jgi:predicted CoA-binding protein
MSLQENIDRYFNGAPFAVVGASRDRAKYGNKVLRAYQQSKLTVYPVNPTAGEIEGLQAYASLADLPETPHGISIVTPPPVTEVVIAQAGQLGIRNVWLQPGSESDSAVQLAEQLGMNVIAGGPCVLVALGYRE